MSDLEEAQNAAGHLAHSRVARFWLRELPYIAVLALTILGVAYTSVSHQPLIGYWEFLAVVTGLVCVTTGWLHIHDPKPRFRIGKRCPTKPAADVEQGEEANKAAAYRRGQGLLRVGELRETGRRITPSPQSQKAADAFLQRLGERQADRDTAVSDQTVQAQLTAIAKWGQAPNSSETLKQVRHPVLIANGDADVMVPTPNSIALFEALPNAKLSIFPDASHGGIFQYADAFVDQALRFLAE